MKALCGLWLLLCGVVLQAQLYDDFSDGDFTRDPVWLGDSAYFLVSDGQLQSNGPASSSAIYLSTELPSDRVAEWRIRLRLLFDPSSSNFVRVYLLTDEQDPRLSSHAYYLQIGEASATLSDSIDLYRVNDGTSIKLLSSSFPCVYSGSENVMDLKVVLGSDAEWRLWADCGEAGFYREAGSVPDAQYDSLDWHSAWFGVYCQYSTSSRSDKYFFDHVYAGDEVLDLEAPEWLDLQLVGSNALSLLFSEPLDLESATDPTNYFADQGLGEPLIAQADALNPASVELLFESDFGSGLEYSLRVSGISDLAGNTMEEEQRSFRYYAVQPYDLIVTEFMADETPSGGVLPLSEYVEIYNRSTEQLNLEGWTLRDNSVSGIAVLPAAAIAPGSYMILCPSSSVGDFEPFGAVLGLSGFPLLNNGGDRIELRTPEGLMTHSLDYTDAWYKDGFKKDGGWSLEMIDIERPWLGSCNWKASAATAQGTPAAPNSVSGDFQDDQAPLLSGAALVDELTLRVLFSESMDSLSLTDTQQYWIEPWGLRPLELMPEGPDFHSLRLMLPDLVQPGVVYSLLVRTGRDCAGLPLAEDSRVDFGLPQIPDSLDLIINEILYDPKTGGTDYVELYNRSDKIVDLFGVFVVEEDFEQIGQIIDAARVSEDARMIFPGAYAALSDNSELVLQQFWNADPASFIRVSGMPSWPDADKEGIVRLEHRSAEGIRVLDRVHYHRDWHHPLLDNQEGTSLERISPEGPSQDAQNWLSAAQSAGSGTPGLPNSAFRQFQPSLPGQLVLEPEIFSPDLDGQDDFLLIRYAMNEAGYLGSVRVFDSRGAPVRMLVNNISLGLQGQFVWDGTNDVGERAGIGIYLIWLEAHHPSGLRHCWVEKAVLALPLSP